MLFPSFLRRKRQGLARRLAEGLVLERFWRPEVGLPYGLTRRAKRDLLRRFQTTTLHVTCASHWLEHIEMAAALMEVPPSTSGAVIECGCFKGGSTANLSLACAAVGRRLIVCDSFQGLPPPEASDVSHSLPFVGRDKTYQAGEYRGSLEEVQRNIRQYGSLEVCEFVPGFYEHTLAGLQAELVLAFLDVDLTQSLDTCLRAVWPLLRPGARLYSHEAQDVAFTSRFFDREWWAQNLGTQPPGFIGAGTGLPLLPGIGSALGYATKAVR
jgi:O-methyltransferase